MSEIENRGVTDEKNLPAVSLLGGDSNVLSEAASQSGSIGG